MTTNADRNEAIMARILRTKEGRALNETLKRMSTDPLMVQRMNRIQTITIEEVIATMGGTWNSDYVATDIFTGPPRKTPLETSDDDNEKVQIKRKLSSQTSTECDELKLD